MTSLLKKRLFKTKLERVPRSSRVGFLIAGTQKAGTAALASYLRKHPEICMARRKEVHFFDNEKYFKKKKINYSHYHRFFDPKSPFHILGEATPIYMYWRPAPRRIWTYNPFMKIIVILRNPIERAYSHWNMQRHGNAEDMSFYDAIRNEPERCRESLPYQHVTYSYVDRGFYSEQLRRIWAYFPRSQVHVIKHDDLRNNPDRTLHRLCSFLNIKYYRSMSIDKIHCIPYIRSITSMEFEYLIRKFEYEIKNIEVILNWDCSKWFEFDHISA